MGGLFKRRNRWRDDIAGEWLVEREGVAIAHLRNWRVPDQFWHVYDAELLVDDPALTSDAFWYETPLTLRSLASGRTVAVNALDGPLFAWEQGRQLAADGTLSLRGL